MIRIIARSFRLARPATGVVFAISSTFTFGVFADSARPEDTAPQATATIAVNVGTFRNTKGALGCRLYRSSAGFPESSAGTVEKRVPINGATARCDFTGLPAGTYAVSVMHDENDNQKLHKNLLGIPTEGYGASNNHTHAMSEPAWDESKFDVGEGKFVGLGVNLRY